MAGRVTAPTADRCVEWATAGRPHPGESVSGDLAVGVPRDGGLLAAVVDGLGHGPEAADAARIAAGVVEGSGGEPVDAVLSRAHDELARTRGVAMTVAEIACEGTLRWAGVGNVEAHVVRRDGHRPRRVASAVLYGGVVGYRLPRVRVSHLTLEPGDLVVLATDGLDPDFYEHLATGEPVERMAPSIVGRWSRPNDDAQVAVVRYLGTDR